MKRLNSIFKLIVILLFLPACAAMAQLNPTDPLPIAPEIRKGKLSNGLTYYIKKNSRPEKKVELRLVVKAGSILEDDDQQGLAHFTEHMAFNGSKNFKKNELVSFLQSIGVEFGADLNAYTGFDETVYILPIPLDKPENFEKGMLVLEDWASTVAFDKVEIDKERGVVLEESRLGKGAGDRMNKVIFPKLFEDSKYANRLPIGKEDILKNFKHNVIKRFYKDWYRPDLMAVVVVGDINPDDAEKAIKSHFDKLKNPTPSRPRTNFNLPPHKVSEGLVVTDKEATNSILQIYYTYKPFHPKQTVAEYRDNLRQNLFNIMLGQRLQELTQKPNPPFIFGASDYSGLGIHGYEVYASFAALGNAGVGPAVSALIEENERARKFGFTAAELDRAKKSLLRNLERAYNERDKSESATFADEYIRNFLDQEPIPGIEYEFNYHKQYLPEITSDEINQFAAHIVPTNESKLIIFTAPEKTDFTLPTNAELLAMVNTAEKANVTAYEEKAVATSLMEKAPEGGKVLTEKENKELGYTELTLGNGVKVILKPTDFKNDQVVMSSTRFGGQSLYPNADQYNAQYATTLVTQMGVKDFSPTDLRKFLAGKTVSVSPRMSGLSEGVNGQCGSADVETMLQLAYLYFTQPRKDEALFSSYVTKQQALYQNLMSNPQAVYQDSIQMILYNKNPRGPRVPKAEDFGKINLDRALQIYKDRFGNANGFSFILVGSFDLAKTKSLVTAYLGSLPSGAPIAGFKDLGIRPVKGTVKKEVKKGQEPKSYITMAFTGEAPYSDEANLKLQGLIEVMNIKLIETLREDLSGIYGGGMRGSLSKNPYNNFSITCSLPCGPENVDKLIKATFDEIQKIKDKGPLEADLNKVKETWITQHKENIKDNNYWLTKLQQSVEIGSDAGEVMTAEKRINALTSKDIKDTANQYFTMKNYLQMVLNPEK